MRLPQDAPPKSTPQRAAGTALRWVFVAATLAAPHKLMAQFGPGAVGPASDAGARHDGRSRDAGLPQPATAQSAPAPRADQRQRLDAGAWLCRTEAALQQHEAAIAARLNGREGIEPVGCRPLSSLTAVSVLERHGPAATEVRVPGQPDDAVAWTDAIVRGK